MGLCMVVKRWVSGRSRKNWLLGREWWVEAEAQHDELRSKAHQCFHVRAQPTYHLQPITHKNRGSHATMRKRRLGEQRSGDSRAGRAKGKAMRYTARCSGLCRLGDGSFSVATVCRFFT